MPPRFYLPLDPIRVHRSEPERQIASGCAPALAGTIKDKSLT
jgi:hypothetical protein